MKWSLAIVVWTAMMLAGLDAAAFCGFYVASAGKQLFNNATVVVMMRDGKRTVLSMQNDYQGPPESFAMVVPVPTVLSKEQVKTLPPEVFERVEELSAPRLVEYWEQDPCNVRRGPKGAPMVGGGVGFGSGTGRLGADAPVKVEARFEVGEYEIVILSASDASALDTWLKDNGYAIPEGAEPYLRPYVAAGSKFFVAKVNADKVVFEAGRAKLSPLRFHYDSDEFTLPIRLGLINSQGEQDIIVNIIAKQRYRVANYPNAIIPTNLDLKPEAKSSFGLFYRALFDKALGPKRDAVVTEYSWQAKSCDPCPRPPLSDRELLTLGADMLPSLDKGLARGASTRARIRWKTASAQNLPKEVGRRIVRQRSGRLTACFQQGDQNRAELSYTLDIAKSGAVTKVSLSGTLASAPQSCMKQQFKTLTFPPPTDGKVSAKVGGTVSFSPGPSRRRVRSSFASDLVLTRLHARYGKDKLGADFVFEQAPAIDGGREHAKETKPSKVNTFQARYVIRHAWPGKIECEEPVRAVWGARPKEDEASQDKPEADPVVATDLQRPLEGKLPALNKFVAADVPPVKRTEPTAPTPAPSASSAPQPISGAPSADAGCGCTTVRRRGAWSWLLLPLALVFRRRRCGA